MLENKFAKFLRNSNEEYYFYLILINLILFWIVRRNIRVLCVSFYHWSHVYLHFFTDTISFAQKVHVLSVLLEVIPCRSRVSLKIFLKTHFSFMYLHSQVKDSLITFPFFLEKKKKKKDSYLHLTKRFIILTHTCALEKNINF